MAQTDKDRLRDLDQRLKKTMAAQAGNAGTDTKEASAASLALKAVVELLVGLGVCMVGGWWLDQKLGTAPWFMVGLMPLGLAAGVLNIMRLSNTKEAKQVMGEDEAAGLSSAPKDDDEE